MRVSIPGLKKYSIDEYGYVVFEDCWAFKTIKKDRDGEVILKVGSVFYLFNVDELYKKSLAGEVCEPIKILNTYKCAQLKRFKQKVDIDTKTTKYIIGKLMLVISTALKTEESLENIVNAVSKERVNTQGELITNKEESDNVREFL